MGVANVFEWGKQLGYSEKYDPRASSALALGLYTIIYKLVDLYIMQISVERLQDHWSSVFTLLSVYHLIVFNSVTPV